MSIVYLPIDNRSTIQWTMWKDSFFFPSSFFFFFFFLVSWKGSYTGICFVSQCIHFIPIVMDCETQQCYNLMCAVVPLFHSAQRVFNV